MWTGGAYLPFRHGVLLKFLTVIRSERLSLYLHRRALNAPESQAH
jgi:hypothetical protein